MKRVAKFFLYILGGMVLLFFAGPPFLALFQTPLIAQLPPPEPWTLVKTTPTSSLTSACVMAERSDERSKYDRRTVYPTVRYVQVEYILQDYQLLRENAQQLKGYEGMDLVRAEGYQVAGGDGPILLLLGILRDHHQMMADSLVREDYREINRQLVGAYDDLISRYQRVSNIPLERSETEARKDFVRRVKENFEAYQGTVRKIRALNSQLCNSFDPQIDADYEWYGNLVNEVSKVANTLLEEDSKNFESVSLSGKEDYPNAVRNVIQERKNFRTTLMNLPSDGEFYQ